MGKSLRKADDRWYFVNVKNAASSTPSCSVYDIATGEVVPQTSERFALALASEHRHDVSALYHPDDGTPGGRIGKTDTRWREIARAIDAGAFEAIFVPITPLRDVYDLLRRLGEDHAKALAKKWTKDPDQLAHLFLRSVQDFAKYDNSLQDFHERRGEQGTASTEESELFARNVAHHAAAGQLEFDGVASPMRYLVHEISAIRTRPDKRPVHQEGDAPGAKAKNWTASGGIDLLLADDQAVNVGEIKSKGDSCLSFAVVQSLMYAAELATVYQLRRLKRQYGARLDFLRPDDESQAWLDVAILYEPKAAEKDDLELAFGLAREVVRHPWVSCSIRQIRFFSSTDGVRFKLERSTAS